MDPAPHPAKFSQTVLDAVVELLPAPPLLVLDPFAGVGLIHALYPMYETIGVELEPEWANQHPRTIVGNALALPFPASYFDAIVTSPCLEQSHRVLTNDLRWVAVGDLIAGDQVLAFDEDGPGITRGGRTSRRRWRRAEVVRSVPRSVECLRVILADGSEIITTPEHPWLANRYAHNSVRSEWVESQHLMTLHAPHVFRQMEPWIERRSFDAGWLSGLYDGEGSLSLGLYGAPKLVLTQLEGAVTDRAEELMVEFGYKPYRIARPPTEKHQKQVNLYVSGGFSGLLKTLGQLRPVRLLSKWTSLDISTRTVQADRVAVLAVESAGRRDIQEIETTTGTFFGEGYMMHNCYGNRMADHHDAQDGSHRVSYRHYLGRPLHPDNSGQLQWGHKYRQFHLQAWSEAVRVLKPGGVFILNVSDHIRAKKVQKVGVWHRKALVALGLVEEEVVWVQTPRMRQGENYQRRMPYEGVFLFSKSR